MADDNKQNDKDKNPNKGGEFRVPPKTWLVWVVIIGSIFTLVMFRGKFGEFSSVKDLNPQDFLSKIESNQITAATLSNYSPASGQVAVIEGTYATYDSKGVKVGDIQFRTTIFVTESLADKLNALPVFVIPKPANQYALSIIVTVLPFVLIGAFIWFFFIRQIKMAGKGALSFGKSKARMLAKERNKTTFKDVAGIDEAIEEVSELVEFLKDPKKISASWRTHS